MLSYRHIDPEHIIDHNSIHKQQQFSKAAQTYKPKACYYPSCKNPPIRSHSIPKNWLNRIARGKDKHIYTFSPFIDNQTQQYLSKKHINTCWTALLLCKEHDQSFSLADRPIPHNEVTQNHVLLHFLRSTLYEYMLIERVYKAVLSTTTGYTFNGDKVSADNLAYEYFKRRAPVFLTAINKLTTHLKNSAAYPHINRIHYTVVPLTAKYPTIAGYSCPSGVDHYSGTAPKADPSLLLVYPTDRQGHHTVIAATFKGTSSSTMVDLLEKHRHNNTALQIITSQELIYFSETWAINPAHYDSFSKHKKDTFEQLQPGIHQAYYKDTKAIVYDLTKKKLNLFT